MTCCEFEGIEDEKHDKTVEKTIALLFMIWRVPFDNSGELQELFCEITS